jgi:hypothetical protein
LIRFDHQRRPLVVGIGGTTRAASSTERALGFALRGAQAAGAHTRLFGGTFLHSLPHYAPEQPNRTKEQLQLIDAVRHADALIIATPGYHGGVSGLVKNALDTLEELRADGRQHGRNALRYRRHLLGLKGRRSTRDRGPASRAIRAGVQCASGAEPAVGRRASR